MDFKQQINEEHMGCNLFQLQLGIKLGLKFWNY